MTEAPLEREAQGTWAELRRRKVVQWGLGYATAAFGLAQGLSHVVSTYHLPEWILQLGTLLLIIGLPIAVVLAWYHGDKGEQKVGRVEIAILAALLLGAVGALWWYASRFEPAASAVVVPESPPNRAVPKDAPSVGVLPFVNLSGDPEQEYFSDGLSEEILNALARVPGLYVPARTSSFQFKNQSGDVARFAQRLGVATILEGSVRKSGGRVRVTAQLVNAADGYHIWSQTYDRELEDIFAIQDEISASIAEALKIHLTAQQKQSAAMARPTGNLDAYEAYLLGRHEANRGRWSAARQHFERAIGLDVNFADAYAGLSIAVIEDRKWYLPSQEALARARELVDKALVLAPRNSEVLFAAGRSARREGRFSEALAYFDGAAAANPGNGEVLLDRLRVLRYLDRSEPMLDVTREAVRRDPLSLAVLRAHVSMLDATGHSDEIGPLLERIREIDVSSWHMTQAGLAAGHGDHAVAFRHFLGVYDLDANRAIDGIFAIVCTLRLRHELAAVAAMMIEDKFSVPMCLGDYRAALPGITSFYSDEYWTRGFLVGEVLYGLRRFDEADAAFERAWSHKGTWPTWGVGSERLMMAADSARHAGAPERAEQYRDWAGKFIAQHESNGIDPGQQLMAMVAAYDGRDEEAVKHLVAAIEKQDAWQTLPNRPLLATFATRTEVQAATTRRLAVLDLQRAEVLRMLCGPEPVSSQYRPAPATCREFRPAD